MQKAPKDDHTLSENRWTQPLRERRAFNRNDVLTEGWYPAGTARSLRVGKARSVRIGWQRIVLFRGEDGAVRALDAFCPHMGADLSNGKVVGDTIQCPMHGWKYDQTGSCVETGCDSAPPKAARLASYPVHEAFGTLWVFSGTVATHPFPTCPGLEGQAVAALRMGTIRLYAHHHAMMVGGIDLQHFKAVHGIDIRFDYRTEQPESGVMDFFLEGTIPDEGWRGRLGRRLLGDQFRYGLRIAGGSIAAISYGLDQKLGGDGRALPALHVLWGCRPIEAGVSEVDIYLLAPKGTGVGGRLRQATQLATTLGLLAVLDDDDKKAFPNMRFDPQVLVKEDRAVVDLMRFLDKLPISAWSKDQPGRLERSEAM